MFGIILFLLIVAIIKFALNYLNQRKFPLLPKNGSILITGCSPPQTVAIGYSIAIALSNQGYQVYAGVLNDQEAQKLKQIQPSLIPVILDVTKEIDIDDTFKYISQQTDKGPLVALINNAGVADANLVEYSNIEMYKKVMNVNAIGHVAVTIKFLPLIMKSKGRIVNITSVAGLVSSARMTQYSMSKYAMEAFTDGLRIEQMNSGVSVSIIEPSFIKTDMVKNLKLSKYPSDVTTKYPHLLLSEEQQKMSIQTIYDNALDVTVVVEAALHAINSPTPKTRYLVAAKLYGVIVFLSSVLPDRIRDQFSVAGLKLVMSGKKNLYKKE